MQVAAGADDTADTVARRYGVPGWVVAQLNNVPVDQRIGADRTLVVPRMANTSAAWADTFVALLLTDPFS